MYDDDDVEKGFHPLTCLDICDVEVTGALLTGFGIMVVRERGGAGFEA